MARQERRHSTARRSRAREERRSRRQGKSRLRRWIFYAIAGTAALSIIIGLLLPQFLTQSGPRAPASQRGGPGEHPSIQPAEHVVRGLGHPSYNSVPATSGWHYSDAGAPISWGIQKESIPDEVTLHNLEHGGVAIQYNTQDEELIAQLEEFAQRLPGYPSCLLVAPYPDMEETIALTAWGAVKYFDDYDELGMQEFADFYVNKGPERLGIDCGPAGFVG